MGKGSTKKIEKDRTCLACGNTMKLTASQLKTHFKGCKG